MAHEGDNETIRNCKRVEHYYREGNYKFMEVNCVDGGSWDVDFGADRDYATDVAHRCSIFTSDSVYSSL